jgi:hypothetical protein
LAKWIAHVVATDTLRGGDALSLRVKFGEAVDQDYETDIFSLDCEIEARNLQSPEEMIGLLTDRPDRIYRAFVNLEILRDEVVQPITRLNSVENEIDFSPCELSLWIGPVECYQLGGDRTITTGWVGLSISGYGYLYPWTFAEVVQRMGRSPAIQRLMQTCQDQWPVAPDKPSQEAVSSRKEIGNLWPYDLNKLSDWYWGLQESG